MKKNNQIRPRRSFIFTPPFKFEMFQKVLSSNVDIICLELEDGVHPNEKETARNAVIKNINKNNTSTGIGRQIRKQ